MTPSLDEMIAEDGRALDMEVAHLYEYTKLASRWQAAVLARDGDAVLALTREVSAFRGRLAGLMLQSTARLFRDRGSTGLAEQLGELATKLGLMSLQYAREHDLPWASEERTSAD